MSVERLIEKVRSQIRDTKEPFVFAREMPATEDTPAVPDELLLFIQSAVQDYSRWRPLKGKPGLLFLYPGQVQYQLPDDFIEMDELPSVSHRLFGRTLHLTNEPFAARDVSYRYSAMHTCETIPAYDESCIVWMASALALRAIVTSPAMLEQYASYKIPDVFDQDGNASVKIAEHVLKTADQLEKQYLLRMGAGGGTGGTKQSGLDSQGPFITFG